MSRYPDGTRSDDLGGRDPDESIERDPPPREARPRVKLVAPPDIYAVVHGLLLDGHREVILSPSNYTALTTAIEAGLKGGSIERSPYAPVMDVRDSRSMPDTHAMVDGYPRVIGVHEEVPDE